MTPQERKKDHFIEAVYNMVTNVEDFEKKDILQILEEVRIMVKVQDPILLISLRGGELNGT